MNVYEDRQTGLILVRFLTLPLRRFFCSREREKIKVTQDSLFFSLPPLASRCADSAGRLSIRVNVFSLSQSRADSQARPCL